MKLNLQLFFALLMPAVGATGYVHGVFITKDRFEEKVKEIKQNQKAIRGTFAIVCRMAIKLKVEDAEDICTQHN